MEYQNGKIYRLVCNTTGDQYVGSSTQPLSKRKSLHKTNYNMWLEGTYGYITSFEIIKGENYDIFLVEQYPCENREQLRSRERYWIENLEGGCVNKNIPTRTRQEYCQDNKEQIRQAQNLYKENNKDQIQHYKHQYYVDNKDQTDKIIDCDCGKEVRKSYLARHLKTKIHDKLMKGK